MSTLVHYVFFFFFVNLTKSCLFLRIDLEKPILMLSYRLAETCDPIAKK